MKKTLAILLALVLAFGLAACSGADKTDAPAGDNSAAAPGSQEDAAPADAAPEETTDEAVSAQPDLTGKSLLVYCGAGMKAPFQAIADKFTELSGCEMNVSFANAAQIQTQISTAQEGAFFIAGAQGEVKPIEEFVSGSVKLVKHIPVLAVKAGNPKGIAGIADLAREDVSTVIGDAESTPIGKIAMQAFSDFGISDSVNLVATTTTAPQLATVIAMDEADAAIVWKENCGVDGVEICDTPDMDSYVKVIPAARLSFAEGDEAADAFSEFLASQDAKDIWLSFGYELAE